MSTIAVTLPLAQWHAIHAEADRQSASLSRDPQWRHTSLAAEYIALHHVTGRVREGEGEDVTLDLGRGLVQLMLQDDRFGLDDATRQSLAQYA